MIMYYYNSSLKMEQTNVVSLLSNNIAFKMLFLLYMFYCSYPALFKLHNR